MGLFKKAAASLGHVDHQLLKTGLLTAGLVLECKPTHVSVGTGGGYGVEDVCDVTVEVHGFPGRPPYRASCKHPIPQVYLPQMQMQGATVAVRVDPDDPQNIALDLAATPPALGPIPAAPSDAASDGVSDPLAGAVTIATPDGPVEVPTHASPIKAPEILARGIPCRATILLSTPLGGRNDAGLDLIGIVFSIPTGGGESYQAQIGLGVPAEAMPLLYPTSELPAKALPDWIQDPAPPDLVTIDWEAALAEREMSKR
ncbi:MAG TPA: hypothetical protein VGM80_04560 [Gaiellaceae bacterium]|jgi:hypothetical protein